MGASSGRKAKRAREIGGGAAGAGGRGSYVAVAVAMAMGNAASPPWDLGASAQCHQFQVQRATCNGWCGGDGGDGGDGDA